MRRVASRQSSLWKRRISSIPYDPALTLGNLIHQNQLKQLIIISELQGEIDAKTQQLENLERFYRQYQLVEMSWKESGMPDEDPDKAATRQKDMFTAVGKIRDEYFNVAFKNYAKIAEESTTIISETVESPLDWTKSQIKSDLPLSADSIKLDSQYFTFDENTQDSRTHIDNIMKFVDASFKAVEGSHAATKASSTTQKQMSAQHQQHDVKSTLVLCAHCTHKNAILIEPCVFDLTKLLDTWNEMFPKDQIPGTNSTAMLEEYTAFERGGTNNHHGEENKLRLLSGATYGSSLVGMVTFVDNSNTDVLEIATSMIKSIKAAFRVKAWFASMEGSFGRDSKTANDLKSMLSSESVQAHYNMYCMGLIPTIASNVVTIGVKEFAQFSPDEMTNRLSVLANETSEGNSIDQGADDAKKQGQLSTMHTQAIKSVMSSLSDMKEISDKVLNVNTMMTALENYAELAKAGGIGVPINYLIKPITRGDIVRIWMKTYYPSRMWGEKKNAKDAKDADDKDSTKETPGD